MTKRFFIDGMLEDLDKEILKTALRLFAEGLPPIPGATEEDKIKSVQKLFELGFLEAIDTGNCLTFCLCMPEDAVHLKAHGVETQ